MEFTAWYERFPERLSQEQEAYREAGFDFHLRTDLLKQQGVVVFEGSAEVHGNRVLLRVLYPPGFPYFRPEIICPEATLDRHQNPYERNLCVIPHEQTAWRASYSGAFMIQQAAELLATSQEGPAAVAAQEVEAPEPVSSWYPYGPGTSFILLEEPPDAAPGDSGSFRCVVWRPHGLEHALQAFLTEIHFISGKRTWRVPAALRPGIPGQELEGSWICVATPPPFLRSIADERGGYGEYLDWAKRQERNLAYRLERQAKQPQGAELIAVIYPDEGPRRGEFHPNWLVGLKLRGLPPVLLRPFLYTRADRLRRTPSLEGLASKRVLVVGLGALGRPLALELARSGVGHLGIVDHDFVDAGPLVRQGYDLRDVGLLKVTAVELAIRHVNPWARVVSFPLQLGGPGDALDLRHLRTTRDLLAEFAEHIRDYDLLISTTGDRATDRLVNEVGVALAVPRIFTWALNGAWGGRVFRAMPGQACFDCLAYRWEGYPSPQQDPSDTPVYARGCGFPTFLGTGFDAGAVANLAVRLTVQTLLAGTPSAYADTPANLINWSSRGPEAGEYPVVEHFRVPRHEQCPTCQRYLATCSQDVSSS